MALTYIERLRDAIRAELSDADLDQPGIDQLLLLYALVAATRGAEATREDVHDAWVTWQILRGETHEAMVPFSELPPDVRAEDDPYVDAIRCAAESQGHSRPD